MNEKLKDMNGFMEDEVKIICISVFALSRKDMALKLDMKFETLCAHLTDIYFTLGIHSLFQLALYADKMGYAEFNTTL